MKTWMTVGTALLAGTTLAQGQTPTKTFSIGDNVLVDGTLFLTDAAGRKLDWSAFQGRALRVAGETADAYLLKAEGAAPAWLSKRNLGQKPVYRLLNDPSLAPLKARWVGRRVWSYGGFRLYCNVTDQYAVTFGGNPGTSARVLDVRRLDTPGSFVSPRGNFTQADMVLNEVPSDAPVVVLLGEPRQLAWQSSAYGGALQGQAEELNRRAQKECRHFAVPYATPEYLARNLSLTPPPSFKSLPNDFDAQERAWLGRTRQEVLWRHGTPNGAGTLADILRAPVWNYGGIVYDTVNFSFGQDDRVTKASIARSP